MASPPRVIEGERFDKPLVFAGQIDVEPERYVAEKPYDLTKYEFSALRRPSSASIWFSLATGATAGVAIAIAGKAIASLLEKKQPTLESWEIWAVLIGIAVSVAMKFVRSDDDKEREALERVINGHFTSNRPRRVHLTASSDGK